MDIGQLVLLITILSVDAVQSYFGLISKMPLSAPLFSNPLSNSSIVICKSLNLVNRRLQRLCREDRAVAETLVEGMRISVTACRKQFEYDRWNCSLHSTRINLLEKAFPETAFMYAISASGLSHSIARACSSGRLRHCTCDDSFNAVENRKTWLWGGCGDNVRFGARFTRRFLPSWRRKRRPKDLTALVERHNSEVGIKVLRQGVRKVCKCHGISGSCSARTCWKQLDNFAETSSKLKKIYESAAKVGNNAVVSAPMELRLSVEKRKPRRHKNNQQQQRLTSQLDSYSKTSLIYLEESPDFCEANRYSRGTAGRTCQKGHNCDVMCCGRGYNVKEVDVTSSCMCRVIMCCSVQCKVCRTRKDVHICK